MQLLVVDSNVWSVVLLYLPPVFVFTLGFLRRDPSSEPKATRGVQCPKCVVLTQSNADGLQMLTLTAHTSPHMQIIR